MKAFLSDRTNWFAESRVLAEDALAEAKMILAENECVYRHCRAHEHVGFTREILAEALTTFLEG